MLALLPLISCSAPAYAKAAKVAKASGDLIRDPSTSPLNEMLFGAIGSSLTKKLSLLESLLLTEQKEGCKEMAKRRQIKWEVLPEEHRDELMKRHLYYVPGVVVSDIKKQIFVSGQTGLRKDSQGRVLNEGDLADQTKVAIERIKTILELEGATLDDVVQVTVFLRDASDREKHAEMRSRYFKASQPASTLVGVNFVHKEMLIEINAIAVL